MNTITTVLKLNEDDTVLVGCSNKACEGCKAQMFCNNKDDSEFLAKNDKAIQLKVGSTVELFLPPGKTILSTVLVFALPLCFFPIGYLVTKGAFHVNELLCALGGIAAMGIAFAVSALIGIKNKKALMPTIVRVIE